MREATRFLRLLTGSFSTPAGANPTGVMIEAAYVHHDIPARFIHCDVAPAGLADAVRGAVAMDWLGFNCSLPHKRAVIPYLDELGESARLIGAVNCVVRREGRLIGENTDGRGFIAALRTLVDPRGRRVTLLGAGGAARAIAVELALAGARDVAIVSRDAGPAQDLVRTLIGSTTVSAQAFAWRQPHRISPESEILINATPVGMAPNADQPLNLDTSTIGPHLIVCDVVMNPPQTRLLRVAASRGARVLGGLDMLINQAAKNIWLWTGVTVETRVLRAALDSALQDESATS
jgi:shikimate dehydrogenase